MMLFTLLVGLASAGGDACGRMTNIVAHTPDGPRPGWEISWEDGIITDLGPSVSLPVGCPDIDGDGRELTPGLIATTTHLGLVEVELESATIDHSAADGDVHADFYPVSGYDPRSSVVGITRAGGITSAAVHPSGGVVSGHVGLVQLTTGHQRDSILQSNAGVVVRPRAAGSMGAALALIDALLAESERWRRQKASILAGRAMTSPFAPSHLDGMQAVLRGDEPLFVELDRASDIEAFASFARDHRLRWVLLGGAEAWMMGKELAADDVPVVLDPLVYGSGSFQQRHGRADNAALLHELGVTVVLTTRETHNARSLRFVAGNAVRAGLPHGEAVRAVTVNAARTLGLEERGRLATGAVADLALWSGDPLQISTRLVSLHIEGRAQALEDRQSLLGKRYRAVERSVDRRQAD